MAVRYGGPVKLAISFLALSLVSPAVGQLPTSTDSEELRQRQRREEEARERRQGSPDVRLETERFGKKGRAEIDSYDLPAESPCFAVKELRLEGDDQGRFSWLARYLSRYSGRCIGREGLNLIARRLADRIFARGYVTTRVGIPEQDISTGTLRFTVVPGVIRKISFADEGTRGLWQTALPMRSGDLLDVRDLDQGLEQMKRVPSQDVDFEVAPGEAPGESDLVLEVKRRKMWRGSLSVDNSGTRATGKVQGTATLSLDSPLGLNDLLSVSGSHDLRGRQDARGTFGGTVFYSVPYGYWTAALSASTNSYHQTVAGQGQEFAYHGRNSAVGIAVQRVLHRDQRSKTSLQVDLGKRWAKTYIEDVEIRVQRRNVTVLGVNLNRRQFIGSAILDGALEYRHGLPWWAQKDPNNRDGASPTTRFHLATLDLSLSVPFRLFGLPFRYLNHSRAQYSWSKLFVSEQFSIGNRYTVRGFDGELTLAAEDGFYTRNEIGVPLARSGQELYAGVDQGLVGGPAAGALSGRALTGSVLGLRGAYRFLSYDAFIGWPLKKPVGFTAERPTLGFMATCQF
jgi:hemolysin activation/secretion protein